MPLQNMQCIVKEEVESKNSGPLPSHPKFLYFYDFVSRTKTFLYNNCQTILSIVAVIATVSVVKN
jgi:hypothetical protein